MRFNGIAVLKSDVATLNDKMKIVDQLQVDVAVVKSSVENHILTQLQTIQDILQSKYDKASKNVSK